MGSLSSGSYQDPLFYDILVLKLIYISKKPGFPDF